MELDYGGFCRAQDRSPRTKTPIQHVIVIVGETARLDHCSQLTRSSWAKRPQPALEGIVN